MTKANDRLDELYREHPDGFVAGRNRLAKELRAAGAREEAEWVKGLRRPSAAAWLLNRIALTAPERLEEYAAAARELESAQSGALSGAPDAAETLRAAAAREREAIDAVVAAAAEAAASEEGHSASERALELAGETLRAASADEQFRDTVLAGRLERERTAATLGTLSVGSEPGGPGKRSPKRRDGPDDKREHAKARKELQRLRQQLERSNARYEGLAGRVERAEQALREEKAKLAESKRESAELKRQVKKAERRAHTG